MTTEQQLEMEKRAAKAYARGFITHTVVGLGKTQEEAAAFYKYANVIFRKYAAIRETILASKAEPAVA